MFEFIDIHLNGFIGFSDMKEFLDNNGGYISDYDVQILVDRLDGDGDGKIKYSEFVAALRPRGEIIFWEKEV